MRILIVDDDSLNRFLLSHMLEEAGFHDCYEAESGREAIQLAEKVSPDLVLLDVMMPDMDGYEVAPILKRMAGDIYLPIIFITALDDADSLVRCLEVGGDDFASKPFEKVVLTAKIRAHSRTRLLSHKTHHQKQELTYYRNAVEREHAIVEHIFANARGVNKSVEHFFDYRLSPASSFNGDLFLTQPSPSGGLYFLMGDFTGHGLASAIGALPVTRAFQAMTSKGIPVDEIASTINHTLLSLLPDDMFFACIVCEISRSNTQITVWNGGMPDLLLIAPDGSISKTFESRHMALGILDAAEFDDMTELYEAKLGERLIGYSDGVIEMVDEQQNMLGEEAFVRWLQAQPGILASDLYQQIEDFRAGAEQLDDITLVTYTIQDLSSIKPDDSVAKLPFELKFDLDANALRGGDPVQDIVTMLSSQGGMERVRSDVSTVLSELFNNALDHGVLKLDSKLKDTTEGFFEYFEQRLMRLESLEQGLVSVIVRFDPVTRLLAISVTDSGEGFDHENVRETGENDTFGRGLPLIYELCHSLTYSDGGRTATASIQI